MAKRHTIKTKNVNWLKTTFSITVQNLTKCRISVCEKLSMILYKCKIVNIFVYLEVKIWFSEVHTNNHVQYNIMKQWKLIKNTETMIHNASLINFQSRQVEPFCNLHLCLPEIFRKKLFRILQIRLQRQVRNC